MRARAGADGQQRQRRWRRPTGETRRADGRSLVRALAETCGEAMGDRDGGDDGGGSDDAQISGGDTAACLPLLLLLDH